MCLALVLLVQWTRSKEIMALEASVYDSDYWINNSFSDYELGCSCTNNCTN